VSSTRTEHPLRPGVVTVAVVDEGRGTSIALASLVTAGLPLERRQLVVVVPAPLPAGSQLPAGTEVVVEPGHPGRRRQAAAAAAAGQYLAFVPGHVSLPPRALAVLVAHLEREVTVGLVAPAVDPAGAVEVLAPPSPALVVRTAVWRETGGPPDELGGVLDELDLGWRTAQLGYRVRVLPEVVVDAPAPHDADQEAAARLLLARRNAEHVPDGDGADPPPDVEALAAARREVQANRRRTDDQLATLLASPTGRAGEPSALAPLGAAAERRRRQVLVVTGDTLGERMAGPAIRAWEMARVLSAECDVVLAALGGCTLTSPDFTCRAVSGDDLRALEAACDVLVFQGFLLRDHPWLLDTTKVLVADIYDPIHLEVLEQDKHKPLAERRASLADSLATMTTQLARADFFLCASAKQRDLWLGHLAALGRINPATYDGDEDLEQLLAIVPFGVSASPPEHRRQVLKGVVPGIGPDDRVVLWGGGIYNWFDPLTLLHAVDRVRRTRPEVKLFFLGTQHPNPAVPAMRMAASTRELAAELGLLGTHVFFNEGWVAYDERSDFLLEADIGVSCHYQHVETAFSFRTRILDYLWAGLPIVTTEGDTFGDLVTGRGLGVSVPAEDVDALAAALLRLLEDGDFARSCREAVAATAQDYVWPRALDPLVRFCRAPHHAADRADVLRPDPAAGLATPPRTLRGEIALARTYLQQGGVREVLRRAAGRLLKATPAA
jgi:glycosyltransferase involved in cell wall biosynthesis